MASENLGPHPRHLVQSEAFEDVSTHSAPTGGSNASLSSESDIRGYLSSHIDSRVLAAYTVIGLREFKLDNKRRFISLAVGGQKDFLTLEEWTSLKAKKAEKMGAIDGKEIFDKRMEEVQSTGATSKFNICIQIDNIGRHQDQRYVKTVTALGQKGADVIKYWWDEHVTRTRDDCNPSMLGTYGRRFEDVVLLGFAPSQAGVWVYSCILGIKSAASDSPAGVQPAENYTNVYMSPPGPGSSMGDSLVHGGHYPAPHDASTQTSGLWNDTMNGYPPAQTMSDMSYPFSTGTSQDFPSAVDQGQTAIGGSSHGVSNNPAYNSWPEIAYTQHDYYHRDSTSTMYSSNASSSLDTGYGSPSGTQQTDFGFPGHLNEEPQTIAGLPDMTANTPHHFGTFGRNAHQYSGSTNDSVGGGSRMSSF